MYSSIVQFGDGTLGVQWDDAHQESVTEHSPGNESFVRLHLQRRGAMALKTEDEGKIHWVDPKFGPTSGL